MTNEQFNKMASVIDTYRDYVVNEEMKNYIPVVGMHPNTMLNIMASSEIENKAEIFVADGNMTFFKGVPVDFNGTLPVDKIVLQTIYNNPNQGESDK